MTKDISSVIPNHSLSVRTSRKVAALFLAALCSTAAHAANVFFTDFIPDDSRVGFMGFEALPASHPFSGVAGSHQEGGISINQVNGQPNDIWTTYFFPEGERGWYPNGGDFGYTQLTLTSGEDFQNVGFLIGTGRLAGSSFATYGLYNNGVNILTGTLELSGTTPFYVGFSGGGFDEIRLREQITSPGDFLSGTENALAIDAIEISVPDRGGSGFACALAAFTVLVALKRRQRSTATAKAS
jgi:hypothetical protein